MTKRSPSPRAARVRRVDVQQLAEQLARSIAEIEIAIRGAEAMIEADARQRIETLRKEASERLIVLSGHQREASRLLRRLASAAEGSWGELEQAAHRALTQARIVADSMLERCRRTAPR